MGELWQDGKYGLRMMGKNPGFSLVAVLTLALGIGANTAIFSVINAVLLRPLPYAAPERLVAVGTVEKGNPRELGVASYPDFVDWRAGQTSFEQMAAVYTRNVTMASKAGAVRMNGAVATSDLFSLLGVRPMLGAAFGAEADRAGGGRWALLSHAAWRTRFDGDPGVVGSAVALNGQSYTIAGVMPPEFQYPIQREPIDLWTNMAPDAETPAEMPLTTQRGNHYLSVVGRLKPGVALAQAEAQVVATAALLEKQYPNDAAGFSVRLRPLMNQVTGRIRGSLLVILAAVGAVLLIACLNVANLMVARAMNRRREIAVRAALGASRWRVVRQMLTESLLLASAGGGLGVLLAMFIRDGLLALNPIEIPRIADSSLDARVLLFTLTVSMLTGVVMGLLPAWQATKVDLQTVLKEGGRGMADGVRMLSVRGALVVVEVAAALMLLVAAGLLLQSFTRLLRVNPGFDPDHMLSMRIGFPDGMYTEPARIARMHDRLLEQLQGIPGVTAYGTAAPAPLSGANFMVGFSVAGRPNPSGRQFPYVSRIQLVGPGYFRTMGMVLRQGRDFEARESWGTAPVAIVNEAFARLHFPNENPIGKRIDPSISVAPGDPLMREIVGVVSDIRSASLKAEPSPEIYAAISQLPALGSMTVLLRTEADPQSVIASVRQRVRELDPNLPIYDVKPFRQYLADSVAQPRFNSLLLGGFAGLALLLTAIGLYGVVAYSVSRRTKEIGIHMALGARAIDVLAIVLGQGMKLILVGVVLGTAGSLLLGRWLRSLLYGIHATDPATFAMVALLLVGVGLLACLAPARRAARVDPMAALREE